MHIVAQLASELCNRTSFITIQLVSGDTETFRSNESKVMGHIRKALLLDITETDDFVRPLVCSVISNRDILRIVAPEARLSECRGAWSTKPIAPHWFSPDHNAGVMHAAVPPSVVSMPSPTKWPAQDTPYFEFTKLDDVSLNVKIPGSSAETLRAVTVDGITSIDFTPIGDTNFRVRFAEAWHSSGISAKLHLPWKRYPYEEAVNAAIAAGAGEILNRHALLGVFQGAQPYPEIRAGLLVASLMLEHRSDNV